MLENLYLYHCIFLGALQHIDKHLQQRGSEILYTSTITLLECILHNEKSVWAILGMQSIVKVPKHFRCSNKQQQWSQPFELHKCKCDAIHTCTYHIQNYKTKYGKITTHEWGKDPVLTTPAWRLPTLYLETQGSFLIF